MTMTSSANNTTTPTTTPTTTTNTTTSTTNSSSSSSDDNKLLIKCAEEDALHHKYPHCAHGPMLLFYQAAGGEEHGFYGCSAYRDKRLCSSQLPVKAATSRATSRRYEASVERHKSAREQLQRAIADGAACHYCLDCNVPLLDAQSACLAPHAHHEVVRNLNAQAVSDPTVFLRPLDCDKAQAQYFFDEKALRFFRKCFNELGISKVVCMGAPRLHAYLRNECPELLSFLLDFDRRFCYFCGDDEYAWYNMCNNHFFDDDQEYSFRRFLKCGENERVLLFTDPPFGCRTEPIAQTIRSLTKLHNDINQWPHQPLPVFWIFPYFAEHYIRREMPALQMCDYKVNYTNHAAYTDVGAKSRKLGSPVRVFTNAPLARLPLPVEEQYKYCARCRRYTALENRHCTKCGICPSKNGATYRHCNRCGLCVKPSYVHCGNCRRCTQAEGHNCREYQAKQRCWICRQRGHTERQCDAWQARCKRLLMLAARDSANGPVIVCLLCGRAGHNEQACQQRGRYIAETTFLGETELTFLP